MWNEAFAGGKAFPVRRVPIEVWSLGRFKFKGIAGTCKVSAPALQGLPLTVIPACCNTSIATCCLLTVVLLNFTLNSRCTSSALYQQSGCTVRQGFVGLLQVMQVYPAELAGRMQLHDYQLNAGKATLVSQGHASCQYQTEINLLDVFQLPMSTN